MNSSSLSGFSEDHAKMDEDVLNYLSTLTPNQQKQLDDFVSFSDHVMVPVQLPSSQLAYGNSVGANHYFGRPMSMYEPFVPENEFSSLPPDLVTSNDPNLDSLAQKYSWEAEDTEYIETLNELRDNFEQSEANYTSESHYKLPCVTQMAIADVHHYTECEHVGNKPVEDHIYATVQKPKKVQLDNAMTASDRSASDPPREKFPKIMTQSCYGELNNPYEVSMWNCYEQDLVQSMENIVEDGNHQTISSLMTDSTIDGVSSMNSSIYEQIPSMTSSIEMQTTLRSHSQRKIVKWWDDHHGQAEESTLDLHGLAEEGKFFHSLFFILIICNENCS